MIFLVFSSLVCIPCTQHHLSIMPFPSPPHRYLPRTRTWSDINAKATTSFLPRNVGDASEDLRKRSTYTVEERERWGNLETATERAPACHLSQPVIKRAAGHTTRSRPLT